MKILWSLFLTVQATIIFAQQPIPDIQFKELTSFWSEAHIAADGKISKGININYGLTLYKDKKRTAERRGYDKWGLGNLQFGQWTLNEADSTLTLIFGMNWVYADYPRAVYKIERLNKDVLLLSQVIDGTKIYFPFSYFIGTARIRPRP